MRDLIGFELKKILARKVTLVSVLVLLAYMVLIFSLNVIQQSAVDNEGNPVTGLAAIAQTKDIEQLHAGPVTDEDATAMIRGYQSFFENGKLKEEIEQSDELMSEYLEYENTHGPCLYLVLSPWMVGFELPSAVAPRIDTSDTVDLYGMKAAKLSAVLDEGMNGTWTYSEAERAYWIEKASAVSAPLEYGYAKGWEQILACTGFLFFCIIAVGIGVTPVFAAEYRDKTDSVILATRYGKSKLVGAKIIAAFAFATGVFALSAVIALGIPLLCYGTDGADLPIQLTSLTVPYDVTMAQAVGVCFGITYCIVLGITAFTLLLSAKLKSVLSIFAIIAALVIIPSFIPRTPSGIVNHILYFMPMNSIDFTTLFLQLASYPLGPAVLDLQSATILLYLLVVLVCVPLAARTFKRHQVS
ncbi:ABC transporter permease [Raoultibacter phocaeensis]|uniref:ABC transporter permease n=1 Tax=Raoultibacter phocaeensis TaxID=2479841 RepID=UPI00111AA566|nr:ABC transporter permease [Raoultibacter phocaeensis]